MNSSLIRLQAFTHSFDHDRDGMMNELHRKSCRRCELDKIVADLVAALAAESSREATPSPESLFDPKHRLAEIRLRARVTDPLNRRLNFSAEDMEFVLDYFAAGRKEPAIAASAGPDNLLIAKSRLEGAKHIRAMMDFDWPWDRIRGLADKYCADLYEAICRAAPSQSVEKRVAESKLSLICQGREQVLLMLSDDLAKEIREELDSHDEAMAAQQAGKEREEAS